VCTPRSPLLSDGEKDMQKTTPEIGRKARGAISVNDVAPINPLAHRNNIYNKLSSKSKFEMTAKKQ
jgi:hypothetical protein